MDTSALPHPAHRLPLLGDVLGLHPRKPVQSSMRMGRDLGPIFARKLLGLRFALVSGADLVAELNDERRFVKDVGFILQPLRAVVGDALFTAEDHEPNWSLAHDILQPAFSRQAMRDYHPAMADVARELLASWDVRADRHAEVDVSTDMTRLTLETIGRVGFGYRFGSFDRSEPHPFAAAMIRVLRYAQFPAAAPLLPLRRVIAGSARRYEADVAYMNRLVDDVIEARRRSPARDQQDLLGLMLETAHPESGRRLDPVNVRQQIITFMVAGHETTSGALSFALYHLTRHPEVLAAARAEVDALWGDRDDVEPAFTDVARLRYVRQVFDESLRLWPTAPGYARAARQATTLGGRYRMEEGDSALVLLPLLHRDPAVWGPDPERFDPDRFAPGRARKRPAHAYKPFGTGQRACIGRQFALHEAVLALALILHRYDLVPRDDYRLRIAESLTLKPTGFRLGLRRRRGA